MGDVFASLVADGLGLPEWLPRAIRRTVIAALAVTVLLFPDTFTRGVAIYVNAQVDRITRTFQIDPAPAQEPRSGPTKRYLSDPYRQVIAATP